MSATMSASFPNSHKYDTTAPTVGLPRKLHMAKEIPKICARREEQRVARTHTAGIEKLPPELMLMVLKDLDYDDIINLRSTSHSMQMMTWPHASKNYFTTIRIPLSREGHDRIAMFVAERADFRDSFTKLVLEAGVHIPSDADHAPLTKKERRKLAKYAKKAEKAIQVRKKQLALAAERQAQRHEAAGTTPDADYTPPPVVLDPDYIKPRKWHRGQSLPTASQKNADTHKGRLYGARVIRKCLELLPSITDITIYHNVEGVKQRERLMWVNDHCTASAEAEALLVALADHPMPKLKRLHLASSHFDRNWNEGLIMLANLDDIPDSKLAALAPTLANLEAFGLSINTNTLDGVSDTAYGTVSQLLRMMPNLMSLDLAVSKRSRKVYPTEIFRNIVQDVPCLRKLENLTIHEWPLEQPAFKAFVAKHRKTLETLTLDHNRLYHSFTPGEANMPNAGNWPVLVQEMKDNTMLRVQEKMTLEHNDPSLMRKLFLRKMTDEEAKKKRREQATEDTDMVA